MVSFPITPDKMVGGFAVPGSRVDDPDRHHPGPHPAPRVVHANADRQAVLAWTNNHGRPNRVVIGPILSRSCTYWPWTPRTKSKDGRLLQGSHVSLGGDHEAALILHGMDSKTWRSDGPAEHTRSPIYGSVLTDDVIRLRTARWGRVEPQARRWTRRPEFKAVELPVPNEEIPAGTCSPRS